MKKVIIIGAGITGLSAGINSLLKGHEVSIYEKNDFVGGCCTGWVRNNFYIDNCMHWLTGTNQHTKLFKLWKKLGAMDETSNLHQGKYFYKSYLNGESISLYCNTEKTRNEMIRISPEDRKEIDKLINIINHFITTNKKNNILKNLFVKSCSYTKGYLKYHKLSLGDLSKKFKHPLLRKMLTDYLPASYSSLAFIISYATFASGNGKIFKDGSMRFSNNIKNRFLELGGNLYLNSEVTKINIENKKFDSIVCNKKTIKGDILISCIDPFYLFNNLLNNTNLPKKLNDRKLYKQENPIVSSFHCAYVIDRKDLKFLDSTIIEIPKIQVGLSPINRLFVKEYSYLNNNDKVVLQTFIVQNMVDYEYWEQLYKYSKADYNALKYDIGCKILDALVCYNSELKNSIELLDTWTPLTYNNYYNSYYGSYMGFVFTKNNSLKNISPKVKDIKNFYYLSYWQAPTGGLPVAAQLGDEITKYL